MERGIQRVKPKMKSSFFEQDLKSRLKMTVAVINLLPRCPLETPLKDALEAYIKCQKSPELRNIYEEIKRY
jgi:hypothetical protein